MKLPEWLRHGLAIDTSPFEPNPEQEALVSRLAKEVVRRGMTVPALAFLEMSQPLNYLASQAMVFFSPMLTAFTDARGYQAFSEMLEHRGAIDYLCKIIEQTAAAGEAVRSVTSGPASDAAASTTPSETPQPADATGADHNAG